MKKVLFYNWIQFDDPKKGGGGVNVYQKNILEFLSKDDYVQCYFLSSGTAYDLKKGFSYIKRVENRSGNKCITYKVVNSPVLAPAFYQALNLTPWFEDRSLYPVIKNFLEKNGPFTAIHFNNFEGLTLECLSLKKDFPQTEFIYSLHNYFPFCPQVNLWYHDMRICGEREFNHGYGCINCPAYANPKRQKLKYMLETSFEKIFHRPLQTDIVRLPKVFRIIRDKYRYKKWKKSVYNKSKGLLGMDDKKASENYKYRQENVKMINKYFDTVLAVSNRVREIAIEYGLIPEKVVTSYIGTIFADHSCSRGNADQNAPYFRIAYMGYARNDKGFFTFMKSLELIDVEIAKKIELVLAVRTDDLGILAWFNLLRHRFPKVIHYNGYTHKELPKILRGVHLGVVPVLWEDNLPQVAIEMAANGVPVLASDAGGASELSTCQDFIVPHNNTEALAERIEFFEKHRDRLLEYWDGFQGLKTMKDHMAELYKYYGIPSFSGNDAVGRDDNPDRPIIGGE